MERTEPGEKARFTSPHDQRRGIVASLLERSYADLLESGPDFFRSERAKWEQFDREVFENLDSVGSCLFLTWSGSELVGFASYDPRQRPEIGLIGHNCVLPEFRCQGFGRLQISEVLRRFDRAGIRKARVSTLVHPFFTPARRMYVACGFEESGRHACPQDPSLVVVEYEQRLDRRGL